MSDDDATSYLPAEDITAVAEPVEDEDAIVADDAELDDDDLFGDGDGDEPEEEPEYVAS